MKQAVLTRKSRKKIKENPTRNHPQELSAPLNAVHDEGSGFAEYVNMPTNKNKTKQKPPTRSEKTKAGSGNRNFGRWRDKRPRGSESFNRKTRNPACVKAHSCGTGKGDYSNPHHPESRQKATLIFGNVI